MIPLFKVAIHDSLQISHDLKDVFDSGFIGQGEKVEEFETLLKNLFNNNNLVSVNSATSALQLALRLIKKKGKADTILTTPLTCTATNWAILAAGYKIMWVDIDPETMNICPIDLANKLKDNIDKVAGIMCVHWGGNPCNLEEINKLRDFYNVPVIEDCAHALLSLYDHYNVNAYSRFIGNSGNYCAFSFQAIKQLTTGDGGMLILPNEKEYKRAKLLRWYGIDRESKNKKDFRCESPIAEWGYKMHMNDINATIGINNYWLIERNRRVVIKNTDILKDELKELDYIKSMKVKYGDLPNWWIYSVLVENRNGFNKAMKAANIMVSQVHERNDIHPAVKEFKAHLPNLESVIGKLSAIPSGWWVSEKEIYYIINEIKKGW